MVFLLQPPIDFITEAKHRGICIGSALKPCKTGKWDQDETSHSNFCSMLGL